MAKLQPQHHLGRAVLCVLDWSARDPVVHLGQRATRAQPAAGGREFSLAVLDQHPGELAVRIPAATDLRGPDHVSDPPQQPRVQRQRRRDAANAQPDREAAQGPGGRGRQGQGGQQLTSGGAVMENTTTAILTGLGTMLVVAAVLAGLVWFAYRLADRS